MTEPEPLRFRIPQSPQQQNDGETLHTGTANTIPPFLDILIHQSMAETEQHDTGLVMWPSALMLSRWIAKHPSVVLDVLKSHPLSGEAGRDILELGAGCGLVGLTAAVLLQQDINNDTEEAGKEQGNVIFTDYNATACKNLERNALLNKVDNCTSVVGLDFFDQAKNNGEPSNNACTENSWTDMEGNQRPQVSLILAAEIICYSNDATMVANTIAAALQENGQAIVMGPQENQRFGIEFFPQACRDAGLIVQATVIPAVEEEIEASTTSTSCGNADSRHDEKDKQALVDEIKQTSKYSYNEAGVGYDFLMFTIGKPISVSS